MKRSKVNAILHDGIAFTEKMQFKLPPWAYWLAEKWNKQTSACQAILDQQLGWDITDFGSGDFEKIGLLLFTLRNGTLNESRAGGKSYAEKIMVVKENQVTPTHFHFHKMEDIINRGGGELVIRLFNARKDQTLDDTPVTVSVDGIQRTIPSGGEVVLTPGESICLTQGMYHRFWAKPGKGWTLVGEVSLVNDDHNDNRFLDAGGRFPQIEEDEPPTQLLAEDVRRLLGT